MVIDQIRQELTEALKARDDVRMRTLRLLISALEYKRMQKNADITPDEEIAVIKMEANKRKEAAEIFRTHGDDDRVVAEEAELKVVQEFLPAQVSEEEVRKVVAEVKQSLAADANKGQLIGQVIAKFGKGTVDGSLVARLVNEK
jgi:hypothetical protein